MGKKTILVITGTVLAIIAVTLIVLFFPITKEFRATFKERFEDFRPKSQTVRSESLLSTFEKAYVGRYPCNFPEDSYDVFFEENPFTHPCDKTMFWSGTKELVHRFTKKSTFITLEDTLLGSIMDGLTWCGMKGSKDTFRHLCVCEPNPKTVFWSKASAEFAKHACGVTTVMLNGRRKKPFDPNSIFGRIEVKNLKSSRVNRLNVILVVTENNEESCDNESLQELRKSLDPKIFCYCHTVTESRINECIAAGQTDSCWELKRSC